MLFVALSSLQGRPMDRAFDDLARLGVAIQLTDPELSSVMLCVAQYWNDEAEDVHAHVLASSRPTPVWPHVCHDDSDVATLPRAGISLR
jgi:hypothetical protein